MDWTLLCIALVDLSGQSTFQLASHEEEFGFSVSLKDVSTCGLPAKIINFPSLQRFRAVAATAKFILEHLLNRNYLCTVDQSFDFEYFK